MSAFIEKNKNKNSTSNSLNMVENNLQAQESSKARTYGKLSLVHKSLSY